MLRPVLVCVLSITIAACAPQPSRPDLPEVVAGDGLASTTVAEAFVTGVFPEDNIDSVATWIPPEGGLWLIATAKDGNRLVVFDGDSGERLFDVGGAGAGAGQFLRPNGIAVFGDLVFVVERDNHRVQVLSLPEFDPVGSFGEDVLVKPYGLWIHEPAPMELEVHVTDSYQEEDGSVPPPERLDARIKRFLVQFDDDRIAGARLLQQYGDTTPAGAIRWIESIVGDPLHDRLLIPEEYIDDEPGEIRVYDMQGRYTGADMGRRMFGGQPEGLALYDCPDGSGYWIATDQQDPENRFHVFDRRSLEHLGTFHGNIVQYTDGVTLHALPTARFPSGVFYAVHADQAVAAFDWREIASALTLRSGCGG